MTDRLSSSTKVDRVFIDLDLCEDCRTVWLNRDKATEPKIAPGISHTVYPTDQPTKTNHQPIHIQLKEIH